MNKGKWIKMKNNSKLLIGILIGIILILVMILILLNLKTEYVEDKLEDNYENNSIVENNVTNDDSNKTQEITSDKAIDIALDDAKLDKNNVYDLDVELENKYGQRVYEVTFDYQNLDYEYYISTNDGSIVKSFKEFD